LKRPTRAIFWDIDGTLLVTGRAGMIAWERAFAAATGGRPFPSVRPDGLTDHQIAAWLLGHAALESLTESEQQAATDLVRRYEALLVEALPLRQGRVLDNVMSLLAWVQTARPPLLSWLVTGNTAAGGAAKLEHYGLSAHFSAARAEETALASGELAGSFSTRVEPRAHIVRTALERAQARVPGLQPSEVLVIGDTPHDVDGAHASGVPVLAVATNTHSLDELRAHHPWRALPVLPEPSEFAALLATTDAER
jgi:phosphoglycolate phosphatase-like HAD superfamily hydrolase